MNYRSYMIALFFIIVQTLVSFKSWATVQCSSLLKDASLAEFQLLNTIESGIVILPAVAWYTTRDVQQLKAAFPADSVGKRQPFYSSDSNHLKYMSPENVEYFKGQPKLQDIAWKMRNAILQSLPPKERKSWSKKVYQVSIQLSGTDQPRQYDHVPHVHRNSIVATLALEGAGSRAIIPTEILLSNYTHNEIYRMGNQISGFNYQATEGQLVIINGFHFRDGGLHAAPEMQGFYPSRFSIVVGINDSDQND